MKKELHAIGKRAIAGYLLRDIPEDLWTAAKHRAVDEGISLRKMILEALRAYLAKEKRHG